MMAADNGPRFICGVEEIKLDDKLGSYEILSPIGAGGPVRQPLSDFEPWGAPLLAVFERWEALVLPPHALSQLTGPMRISPCSLIK